MQTWKLKVNKMKKNTTVLPPSTGLDSKIRRNKDKFDNTYT